MDKVSNWGFFPEIQAEVKAPKTLHRTEKVVKESGNIIARGNGRCYGDSSLNKKILSTLGLKKFLSLDLNSGLLVCESGLLLNEILEFIVPKGFFLPVTPGTKFITLGGAVASNIHGKNHHKEGSICEFIQELQIITEEGNRITANRNENSILFKETIGGMGLTGVIYAVTLQLKKIESSYINTTSIKARNLEELISLFQEHKEVTYSVAWIDCLAKGKNAGRSILMLGEHSSVNDLGKNLSTTPLKVHKSGNLNVPFKFPSFVLNKLSIQLFNFLYYNKQLKKVKKAIVHYEPYFYPLDKINNWNRIYGRKGFTQYQFVIPFKNGKKGLEEILKKIADAGEGSFLAVLKTFGDGDQLASELSFPEPGYTLALDFKLNTKVLKLLDELDQLVLKYNGKVYLTKDSRMNAEVFKKMYPHLKTSTTSVVQKFTSLQSSRLKIPNLLNS